MNYHRTILINVLCIYLFIYPKPGSSQNTTSDTLSSDNKSPFSYELRGYISNMQSVSFTDVKGNWVADNLFHNRLNFFMYYRENFTASLQLRNRFMYGQSFLPGPDYASSFDNESNFLDLSVNIFEERSFLLNSSLDRAYLQFTAGKFVFTGGRQRINWGQALVWNPNDVFNVQNFFDFDYMEKQGSDAIRMQYYPGYTSTAELAAKLDKDGKMTIAALYRFNKWSYDVQFLGGLLSEEDLFAGLGWSGDIKGAGFRGEFSYFHPLEHSRDTSGIFLGTLSADYTFSNSLYIQAECLYNKKPGGASGNFYELYQGSLDVKNMAFSEWNALVQASYPLTPLINISLAGMYLPEMDGYYMGPNLQYSLKDNAELSLIFQVFSGRFSLVPGLPAQRTDLFFGFLRYRFSF